MTAVLSVLGETPSPGVPVSISSLDDFSLTLAGAPPVPLCSPVKVIQNDRMWLGEVVECHPDGVAIVKVIHTLNNLKELSRLADRFTGRIPAEREPEPTLS